MSLTSLPIFWFKLVAAAFRGDWKYFCFILILLGLIAMGLQSYTHHLTEGLIVTRMTDEVSWGIGIANFTFFVGIADAVVALMVPAYIFRREEVKDLVIIGLILSVAVIVMCLLFIMTDLGRPERVWHLVPFLIGGRLNLPSSLLAWDVVVFNGYLLLSFHIPSYLLYKRYKGETPSPAIYLPFIFASMIWAIVIHTVTAFLLSGLGSRAFWNSSILAPRFLISAFASGPALLILLFSVLRKWTSLPVTDYVFDYMKSVIRIMMPINLFLLSCEVFKEFYTDTLHASSAYYLFFGLHGHNELTRFIWTATAFNIAAAIVFLVPRLHQNPWIMHLACVLAIVGVWTEKGLGLVIPGFVPTPLGAIVEYMPNWGEIQVSLGIGAIGVLIFTFMAKGAIAVLTGKLKVEK